MGAQIFFHFSPEIVTQIYGSAGPGAHLVSLLETHPAFVSHGVANLTNFYQGRPLAT